MLSIPGEHKGIFFEPLSLPPPPHFLPSFHCSLSLSGVGGHLPDTERALGMSMTPSAQSISQLTKRAREREPTLSGAMGEVITQLEDKCCGR